MKFAITAQRLSEALNDKKMKPQDLADKSGVNKGSISLYMNGKGQPGNLNAGKMAEVLGVNPMWLMGFDVDKHETETKPAKRGRYAVEIDVEVGKMSIARRKALLEYAKFLNGRESDSDVG